MKHTTKQFMRGGQIFLYQTKMFTQVTARIGHWAFLLYCLCVGVILLIALHEYLPYYWYGLYSQGLELIGLGNHLIINNSETRITAHHYLTDPIISQDLRVFLSVGKAWLVKAALFALVPMVVLTWLANRYFIKVGDRYSHDQLISGTTLITNPKKLTRLIERSERGASDIKLLGQVPLPKRAEFQGNLFHGSTGTGKTQAIQALLDEIQVAGDPAIIYDKENVLKPHYYQRDNPGHIDLNVFSRDCPNWLMWEEFNNPLEWSNFSMYLMPKSLQGDQPFWVDSARTIFTALAWKLRDHPQRSPIFLLQALLTTSLEELQQLLKGTEAETLVNKEIEKTAISIKSVLATYTKSLRFLAGLETSNQPHFSINHWVKTAFEHQGWLFISSTSKYHHGLKPLLTSWLGLAMSAIQSLPPNTDRRLWLVIDELASLHRLEMLSDTAADIRKFGGCMAVGIQSFSQLQFLYGQHEANAIADLLNSKLYSRSNAADVAKWVSANLGEQVIEEVRESQSYGPNPIRDGNTIGTQRVTRPTVYPSDIESMKDLEYYVRLLGTPQILHTQLAYQERPVIAEPFKERPIDFDALQKITAAALQAENDPRRDEAVKRIQAFEEEAKKLEKTTEPTKEPKIALEQW